jgi:endoglucanase
MSAAQRLRGFVIALVATAPLMTSAPGLAAQAGLSFAPARAGTLTPEQWRPWRDRFVTDRGRVVDDINKISHSEGQGYGLLLALLAQDKATFARIWSFTKNELLLRDDGLAAWRWDPDATPHVTDTNDAADGDILIAYALALAGEAWKDPELTQAAHDMALAIKRLVLQPAGARMVVMPAVKGFGAADRPDGPVVNLSYWVFEAFPTLARLAPDPGWAAAAASGVDLVRSARFGPARLPPNWISLHGQTPEPAQGFDQQFSYDAIRVPLYLLRAGIADRDLLGAFAKLWGAPGAAPAPINLSDARVLEGMGDPGYRMIAAALACALDAKPIPTALKTPTPTSYYPSTLHLLALSMVAQHFPACL